MNFAWDWTMLDHAVGVVSFVGLLLLLMLRSDLKKYFATKEDLTALNEKLASQDKRLAEHRERVEHRLASFETESRSDFRALDARLVLSEVAMADVRATLTGVKEGVAAVQKGIDMLLRHELDRERS